MKKNGKKNLVIVIIAIIVIIVILSITLNKDRKISKIEAVFKDSALFLFKVTNAPVNFVKKQIAINLEKEDLYKKYTKLKAENENLKNMKDENNELKYQLNQIKGTLELNNLLNSYAYLNATAVSRNVGLWYNSITIDKGLKSGVELDMPVIVKEGLIGLVSQVSNFNSSVKLLTTTDYFKKISVKIEIDDTFVYGLLSSYNHDKKLFVVEGIEENINIPVGSLVTTTGLSNTIPAGLKIGTVFQVATDNFDLSKIAYIKSDVNFDNIDYVTIIKKEVKE